MSDEKQEGVRHTPGPWVREEYNESLGYDCMTGGIRSGPAVLDGADYGQGRCKPISPEQLAQMEADARLISAAPGLLAALQKALADSGCDGDLCSRYWHDLARAAIAKATEG